MISATDVRLSNLTLGIFKYLLTFLRSKTRRSFLPSATVNGLTHVGGSNISRMQRAANNSSMEDLTNCGCLRLDLLFLSNAGGGKETKGNEYPDLIIFSTKFDAGNSLSQNFRFSPKVPAVNFGRLDSYSPR